MYDTMTVNSLESMNQTSAEKPCLFLTKFSLTCKMKSEVSSEQQIHDQIQVFRVLKSIVCINDKFAIDYAQQFEFIHDRLDTFLMHHPRLEHFFHRELLLVFSFYPVCSYSPNFAETTSSDSIFVFK